jgi:hypothetical protein
MMKFKQLASLAGMIGPVFFGIMVTSQTLLEYDFMRSLGWHPLHAPTLDWPSGLALGPYGMWMTTAFIVSGLLLFFFAFGLRAVLKANMPSKIGSMLLACSGLAVMGLAFTTDPTFRSTPATWHGRLHDFSFVLLGLTFLPALLFLAKGFLRDAGWRNLCLFTWLTVLLAAPAFVLKGIAFYAFLLATLVWNEAAALRVNQLRNGDQKKVNR